MTTTTTATNESVVVKTLARNHFCLDQNLNPRVVQTIAKSLPWYGPKFSPHDVPNFYDVSGITENPEAFKLVVDTFAERYESMKEKPTKIAGFDARGFLFGPTIAMRLGRSVVR
jgi:adenine phosphoribosyltransferase